MNRTQPIFWRRLPRPAAVAGLLSALLVLAGKPALAANPGQEQISKDFQKTVTLGAGQSVSVEHKFGEVKLHGEAGREVKISSWSVSYDIGMPSDAPLTRAQQFRGR